MGPALSPCLRSEALSSSSVSPLMSSISTADGFSSGVSSWWHATTCPWFYRIVIMPQLWLKWQQIPQIGNTDASLIRENSLSRNSPNVANIFQSGQSDFQSSGIRKELDFVSEWVRPVCINNPTQAAPPPLKRGSMRTLQAGWSHY